MRRLGLREEVLAQFGGVGARLAIGQGTQTGDLSRRVPAQIGSLEDGHSRDGCRMNLGGNAVIDQHRIEAGADVRMSLGTHGVNCGIRCGNCRNAATNAPFGWAGDSSALPTMRDDRVNAAACASCMTDRLERTRRMRNHYGSGR